ncbi:hypothetical protein [Streptomyces sp. P9-A4]|uniref:hypothetical protein n=1 Tax=Streptomyces sp. P9-A4 TaxID=3072285 RepID=UPI002FCC9C66
MLGIHFTAEDLTRVRIAPRPSPLPELHAALMMLGAPHEGLLFGGWRSRLLRALPGAAEPHAAALRAAGLITTTRTGRSVHHARTALGTLPAAP